MKRHKNHNITLKFGGSEVMPGYRGMPPIIAYRTQLNTNTNANQQ